MEAPPVHRRRFSLHGLTGKQVFFRSVRNAVEYLPDFTRPIVVWFRNFNEVAAKPEYIKCQLKKKPERL